MIIKLLKIKEDHLFLLLINNVIFLSFYKYSGVSIYITPTINYTWMHDSIIILSDIMD